MNGTNPHDQLENLADSHPFIEDLDIRFETFDGDTLEAHVPHSDCWANPGTDGAIHSGIVMSYPDTVMGFTLLAASADRSFDCGPTVNLNTNFFTPATSDMTAIGEIVRLGSTSAVVDGRLEDAVSGDPIATAQNVWRIYPLEE